MRNPYGRIATVVDFENKDVEEKESCMSGKKLSNGDLSMDKKKKKGRGQERKHDAHQCGNCSISCGSSSCAERRWVLNRIVFRDCTHLQNAKTCTVHNGGRHFKRFWKDRILSPFFGSFQTCRFWSRISNAVKTSRHLPTNSKPLSFVNSAPRLCEGFPDPPIPAHKFQREHHTQHPYSSQ